MTRQVSVNLYSGIKSLNYLRQQFALMDLLLKLLLLIQSIVLTCAA